MTAPQTGPYARPMGTIAVERTMSAPAPPIDRARRDAWALAGFGTWMIIGLFLDGFAHREDKPETFFSPWHAVLYSGFGAAVAWFGYQSWRARGRSAIEDRLGLLGMAMFAAGGVGDMLWHLTFGIEQDLETLLSPTHLLLMTGGLLMLSAPIRWAWTAADMGDRPSLRTFAPALIGMSLAVSVVTFFFMYLAAAWPIASNDGDEAQAFGIASVLARNTMVVAPLLFLLRRWTTPFGSATVMFGVTAVLMAALQGFEGGYMVLPFVIAGVFADLLIRQLDSEPGDPRAARLVGALVPLVLWTSFFAVNATAYSFRWPAEIWTGATFLAALSTYALAIFMHPARAAVAASGSPRLQA